MKSRLRIVLTLLFPGAFIALGGWVLNVEVSRYLVGEAAEGWSTVEGQIVSCEVVPDPDSEHFEFLVNVEYSYVVDARQHRGTRIRSGPTSFTHQDDAERLAEHFPAGDTVVVHYDPVDPGHTVLLTGVWFSSYVGMAFGAVSVVVGLTLFTLFVRALWSDWWLSG